MQSITIGQGAKGISRDRIMRGRALLLAIAAAVLLGLGLPAAAQQITQDDVELICSRLSKDMAARFPDAAAVKELTGSLQADGSWKDIDYLSTGISVWSPRAHLGRVSSLARAYVNASSPLYHDKTLGEAVHRSLDFWLLHNYTSRNWWANDIGIPNTLGNLFILLRGETTEEELLRALNQMRGAYISQTGQNRVWRAEIQLKTGLITFGKGRTNLLGNPTDRIVSSASILQEEVEVTSEEGIQPDWSFQQHGVQQQFGNYGLAFASTQSRWVWALQGTPVAYKPEKVAVIRNYVLNGLSRVVWKGTMDISGCGRQLSPNSPESKGGNVMSILRMMEQADPSHAAAYHARYDELAGKPASGPAVPENFYYWRSDLLVHRSSGFYSSVRTCSRRILRTESINGENLLGYHLADGATYVYVSGKEYHDIFPVWDWRHIPGVTAYSKLPLPSVRAGGMHNESDFVGGVSDTTYGMAAFLFLHDGLSAHKSWFYTDEGIVCLGAGITSRRDAAVSTTLNQSLLEGTVSIKTKGGKRTLASGQAFDGKGLRWVRHAGIAYLMLGDNTFHVGAGPQQGSWKRIHSQVAEEPLTKEVFSLWIDHGVHPVDGSYSYLILPGAGEKNLDRLSRKLPVKVLHNDTALQAVVAADGHYLQAVFYQAGSVSPAKGPGLTADGPCLVIARRAGDGLAVTASVPPEMPQALTLSIRGHFQGENTHYDHARDETVWKVPLPGDIYQGSSVTVQLRHP